MQTAEELVKKWELSGLLEGAINKEGIARCLEDIAQYAMLNAATLKYAFVEEKKLAVAVSLLLPVARLALGKREFTYSQDKEYTREVFEIDYPAESPNDVQPEHCSAVGDRISKVLDQYKNLRIHGFVLEFLKEIKDKFEVHLLCSEKKVE